MQKIFLASFGRFWIIFYISDLGIFIFILKRSTVIQQDILEAHFPTYHRIFHSHFSERPAGISNVRPESRTLDRNL